MVLFMPRPFKHKATGVYWLRQRTPANVKAAATRQIVHLTVAGLPVRRTVGAELVVSLGTKDPAEAKKRAVDALEQFDAIWASFANPAAKLTFKEIVALAGEAFRAFQAMEDDPASPEVRQLLVLHPSYLADIWGAIEQGPWITRLCEYLLSRTMT